MTIFPEQIQAGDTFIWNEAIDGYPASEWTLNLLLVDSVRTQINIPGNADGDNHTLTIGPAVSEQWPGGRYEYQLTVVNEVGDSYTVGRGTTHVLPWLGATDYDGRSPAQKVVDAIDALLTGVASSGQLSIKVSGVELENYPPPQLLQIRDRYAQIVNQEKRAADIRNGRKSNMIRTRFN